MLVDGPHFQATNGGELIFLLSDGDSSRRPGEHRILDLEEESRAVRENFNYYLRIPLEHPDSQRWRAEIAKYLAPHVLGSTYKTLSLLQCAYSPSSLAHGPFPDTLPTFAFTATLNAPWLPSCKRRLIQSSTIHIIIVSHTTYDSHDGPPTLDARRLPTRIRPAFALSATQDPVFQTPSRLLPLRYASSSSPPIPRSLTHVYMYVCMNEYTNLTCVFTTTTTTTSRLDGRQTFRLAPRIR
jgi:hypothetical protein